MSEDDARAGVTPGIREWLVLFVVFMALNVLILAYDAMTAFVALSWAGVLYGVQAIVLVVGLVLVYQRDPLAPRFWRGALIAIAAFNVLLGAAHAMEWSRALFMAGVLIAWAVYWHNSQLVRATFVPRASMASSGEVPEEPTDEVARDAEPVPSIEELNAELELARRQEGLGVLYILIGLTVTAGTYALASSAGGTYFVTWGAVLYGIIQSVRAHARRTRAQGLLRRMGL